MTVHFIGAGPGAADLVTLRGRDVLAASPVCVYAGALVPPELLEHCPPGARLVDSAQLTLDEITDELVAAHVRGEDVARLHSGDPAVFSAMAEQMRRLDSAGVPYDVVPGVPAFAAAAAALRRELTVPGVGQTVVLTRIARRATAMPAGEELAALAASRTTLVLHLAVQHIEDVVDELTPHYGPDCPVAVCANVSRPDELLLRGTLADIAEQVTDAGVRRSAVIVVGAVLTAETFRDSHLYSARRERSSAGDAIQPRAQVEPPADVVPMSRAASLDHAFLTAAGVVTEVLARPSVRDRWSEPSALERMSIGALACHLGRQLARVAELAAEPSNAEPIEAAEHYRRAAWVTATTLDDPSMDRSTDDAEAALGPDALLQRISTARDECDRLLTTDDAADVVGVPWQGWALRREQFLLTRLVEIVVHTDDLAASLAEPTPQFPPAVFEPVAHLLTSLAASRHGQSALIRTLSRAERAPAHVSAF